MPTSSITNICGKNIAKLRTESTPLLTQESLAAKVQRLGIEIDRAAIAKIETQKRRVNDFEVVAIAQALNVSPLTLLESE